MLDITKINEIIRRYQDGESSTGIAKDSGVCAESICKILNDNGIEIRYKRNMTTKQIDDLVPKMIELFKEGNKIVEISEITGVGERVISRRLTPLGYITRKVHRSKDFLMKNSQEIIEMYKSGLSTVEIGKKFDCVPISIWRVIRDNNEKTNPSRIYDVNHNFFEKIDSEMNAYYLGLWFADGNISTKGQTVSIGLVDTEIITRLKTDIEYTGDAYIKKAKGNQQEAHILRISSPKMRQDLINLGCIPNKTFELNFPALDKVPEHLVRHFIRGYLDGDGSIHSYNCERWKINGRWTLNFVGTENMMKGIENEIQKQCELISGIYCYKKNKTDDKNTWLLDIKNYNIIPVLQWLYKDATIYLERKYQKYQELLESYASKGLVIAEGEKSPYYYYNVPKKTFVKRNP